uniref:(California timema) hypothetical protein n=1 Tax=Timema californicum TaxID=61474 RepID=A0A7R9JGM1_TIMCA|nr:unnamed protein product [Timema californicum]
MCVGRPSVLIVDPLDGDSFRDESHSVQVLLPVREQLIEDIMSTKKMITLDEIISILDDDENILEAKLTNFHMDSTAYIDTFFTSVRLLEELKSKGHYCTGTIRSNRIERASLEEASTLKKKARRHNEAAWYLSFALAPAALTPSLCLDQSRSMFSEPSVTLPTARFSEPSVTRKGVQGVVLPPLRVPGF